MPVYDDQKTDDLNEITGIGKEAESAMEDQARAGAKEDLAAAEASGGFNSASSDNSDDSLGAAEAGAGGIAGQIGNGFNAADVTPLGRLSRLGKVFWGSKGRKRTSIGGAIAAVAVGGGMFGMSFLSGPFEFVHLAQLLQQFHFSRINDFQDDRSMRTMLYALSGQGERSRLGRIGNKAADRFEKNLLDNHGVRPVYEKGTHRFVGYEIVDESKAGSLVNELEQSGAQTTDIGKDANKLAGPKGAKLDGEHRMINLKGEKTKLRRQVVRSVTKAADIHGIAGTLASRLEIKRGGVQFHPLRDIKDNGKQKLADWIADYRKKHAEKIRQGLDTQTTSTKSKDTTETDSNGDTKPGEEVRIKEAKSSSKGANKLIEKMSKAVSKDAIKNLTSKSVGPAIVVGILCAVKGFGNEIPLYKYQNIVMPMIRMGMDAITVGNQIMSGQDLNANEMAALGESLYQPEVKKDGKVVTPASSWSDARSIQAELGQKQTGPDLPNDDKLTNVNDKPWIFNVLDHIPGLGAACSVAGAVSHIPVINKISDAASWVVQKGADLLLAPFHTSVDDLMQKALAAAAGQSVNVLAQGAEYGNIVNTGTYLAANDQAIAMGGAQLTPTQTAQINTATKDLIQTEASKQSFKERYLDPYNPNSLMASVLTQIPHSFTQMATSILNPVKDLSRVFSSTFGLLSGKSLAAAQPYDYGVPMYGFSLATQNDPAYEDPYENAKLVEPHLDELNNEYSECFGVKAVPSGSDDVNLENISSVNELDLQENKDGKYTKCNPATNNDPLFTPYRMYLADLISAKSMACYEVNDTAACSQLGFDSSPSAGSTNTYTPQATGSASSLAQQVLTNTNITLSASAKSDIEATANGQTVTPGPIGDGSSGLPGCSARTPTNINADLLKVALNIAQKYKYQINDIVSGHDCDTGKHPIGRAMDIFFIDSKPLNDSWWSSSANVAVVNDIGNIVHQTGSYQFGFGVGCSAVSKIQDRGNLVVFNDSCNPQDEIHIDVRGAP